VDRGLCVGSQGCSWSYKDQDSQTWALRCARRGSGLGATEGLGSWHRLLWYGNKVVRIIVGLDIAALG